MHKKWRSLVKAQPKSLPGVKRSCYRLNHVRNSFSHCFQSCKKKGKIKWLSCYGAYGGGGGEEEMIRSRKTRMSQVSLWLKEERNFTRVGSVQRQKVSWGELTLKTVSMKVGKNHNMHDSNTMCILAFIWFVIPLELIYVFVMIKGYWFQQWHHGDNHQ